MRAIYSILILFLLSISVSVKGQMYEEWATKFGSYENTIFYASSMVIDEQQNAYVCARDVIRPGVYNQFAIIKFNAQGLLQWRIDSLPWACYPSGVPIPQGSPLYINKDFLYCVNVDGVSKYDLNGNLVWKWLDVSSPGSLKDLAKLIFNDNGDMALAWVSDDKLYRLVGLDSNGIAKWDYSSNIQWISWLHYLTFDGLGNLYAVYQKEMGSGQNDTIQIVKYDFNGNASTQFSYLNRDNSQILSIHTSNTNDSLFVVVNYINTGDSVLIFDSNIEYLGSNRDVGVLKKQMFFEGGYYYDLAYRGYSSYTFAKRNANGSNVVVKAFPDEYYSTSFFRNGFLYAVSSPTTAPREGELAHVFKMDTNLNIIQTLELVYTNPKPNGYGVISTQAQMDSSDNIFVFMSGWGDSGMVFKICQHCSPNIKGTVYYDKNTNCSLDSTDYRFINRVVEIYPGPFYTLTDIDGNFGFIKGEGVYTVKQIRPDYWNASCLDSITFKIDSNTNPTQLVWLDNVPQDYIVDKRISMVGGPARPGFAQSLNIKYENRGTLIDNGWIQVVVDSNFSLVNVYPPYDAAIGNTYFWNYDSLVFEESRFIQMVLQVPVNIPIGYPFTHTCIIGPDTKDYVVTDNYDTISSFIQGSYDPNDKQCTVKNGNETGNLTDTSTLIYTIRFQNTGTDTAFTVTVLDTLDEDLDLATFDMIQASSNYELTFAGNRVLRWTFSNILLPDSHTNEMLSHGFIKYSIKPKRGLPIGAVITNSASIYFDFNVPVKTNTTYHYHQLPLGVSNSNKPKQQQVVVIPNPANSYARIFMAQPTGNPAEAVVYDFAGKRIHHVRYDSDSNMVLECDGFAKGIYLVEIWQNNRKAGICKLAVK